MQGTIGTLMAFIAKHFTFDKDTYPDLKSTQEKEIISFAIRHLAIHFSKTAGKIAAVSEAADHGKEINIVDLKTETTKALVNTLRLAELLGMTEDELVRNIEKQYHGKKNEMNIEIEGKFLDIDIPLMREKLQSIGAICSYPEVMMRRKNFDYPNGRLQAIGGWARVRDEGNRVTMAYKQLMDRSITGMREVEVTVNSFDDATALLTSIGLVESSYYETKRERWHKDDIEIDLDTWPWIPSFIEIEGKNEGALIALARDLGLDWSKVLHGSVEIAYMRYYDVTEEEVDGWPLITFSETPNFLEAKRKLTVEPIL